MTPEQEAVLNQASTAPSDPESEGMLAQCLAMSQNHMVGNVPGPRRQSPNQKTITMDELKAQKGGQITPAPQTDRVDALEKQMSSISENIEKLGKIVTQAIIQRQEAQPPTPDGLMVGEIASPSPPTVTTSSDSPPETLQNAQEGVQETLEATIERQLVPDDHPTPPPFLGGAPAPTSPDSPDPEPRTVENQREANEILQATKANLLDNQMGLKIAYDPPNEPETGDLAPPEEIPLVPMRVPDAFLDIGEVQARDEAIAKDSSSLEEVCTSQEAMDQDKHEVLVGQVEQWLKEKDPHQFFRRFIAGTCNKNLSYNEWPEDMQKHFNTCFRNILSDRPYLSTICRSILRMRMGHIVAPHIAAAFVVVLAGMQAFVATSFGEAF